jgi:hypothetical protein
MVDVVRIDAAAIGSGVLKPISDCLSNSSWPIGVRSQRKPISSVSLDVALKLSRRYRPSSMERCKAACGGETE